MSITVKNICCIGAGYVGGPTMAVIAEKCPNLTVEVVDLDEGRIDKWNSDDFDELPIYEPGLAEIIERCRGVNLNFSTSIEEKIKNADMVFISVNTPTKKRGLGAGKASDLKWVEACARQVANFAEGHTIVVEKSTLPVRTAEAIKSILKAPEKSKTSSKSFDVLSNPEFLAEGTAIKDLRNPDRVLIGGERQEAINALSKIYLNWVPKVKILETNIWSSELAKLTANAFLAQRISSINSISALCEETGADIREVSRAIGSDTRIGSKFLDSGPGFGGSCFKKDILNLVYLAEYFGLPEVAKFWNEVVEINKWHQNRISKLIIKNLFGTLSGKKVAILGFAFKRNTNDTRESPAIQICKNLLEEGAYLEIHDPKVNSEQITSSIGIIPLSEEVNKNLSSGDINKEGKWNKVKNLYDCFDRADCVVALTEWDEYSSMDWVRIEKLLRKPSWVFDVRSILNKSEIIKVGLNFWRVGDSA